MPELRVVGEVLLNDCSCLAQAHVWINAEQSAVVGVLEAGSVPAEHSCICWCAAIDKHFERVSVKVVALAPMERTTSSNVTIQGVLLIVLTFLCSRPCFGRIVPETQVQVCGRDGQVLAGILMGRLTPELSGPQGRRLRLNDLLAIFSICLICIGLPLGAFLGTRLARHKITDDLRCSGVKHISKLDKNSGPFVIDEFPKFGVFCVLLLLEIKLLFKELFLKAIGKASRNPSAEKCAEHNAANTSKRTS